MKAWGFKLLLCAVALATVLFTHTSRASDWTAPADLKEGNARFAAKLYRELARNSGNLFVSPTSIHTALGMTYMGARGDTASEMARTMEYSLDLNLTAKSFSEMFTQLCRPDNRPRYQLNLVNALWGQQGYPISEDFKTNLNTQYGAKYENVDFKQSEAARKTINDWVAAQTQQRIQNLIPPPLISPQTRLVLTNAIYFKSEWNDDFFNERNTENSVFHTADGDVKAPMMRAYSNFEYGEDATAQVVKIPYRAGDLNYFLILPKDKNGLGKLEADLSAEQLKRYLAPTEIKLVELRMPKFKLESEFLLKETLSKLGMPTAFSDKADFNNMLAKPIEQLCIGEVVHKAFIALDEKGTEAAAATAVVMKPTGMKMDSDKRVVTADHPFLFVIQHKATQSILFMGRVANPAK